MSLRKQLTREQQLKIVRLYRNEDSPVDTAALAARFGVSRAQINSILNRAMGKRPTTRGWGLVTLRPRNR